MLYTFIRVHVAVNKLHGIDTELYFYTSSMGRIYLFDTPGVTSSDLIIFKVISLLSCMERS